MTPDLILEPTNPSSSHVLMASFAIEVEITLVRSIGDLFFAHRLVRLLELVVAGSGT